MEARGRVLQELDKHAEALPALQDAVRYCDPDQPASSLARLHYAIAQVRLWIHWPGRKTCTNWLYMQGVFGQSWWYYI